MNQPESPGEDIKIAELDSGKLSWKLDIPLSAVLGMAFVALYFVFKVPFFPGGDSAKYTFLAEHGEVFGIPIHIAHIVAMIGFIHGLAPLGVETYDAAVLTSSFFGGLSVALCYWIALVVAKLDRPVAVFSALVFGLSGIFFFHGAVPQYATLQVAATLAAFLAMGVGSGIGAGLAMGVAGLTTPAAIYCMPAVAALARKWRPVIWLFLLSGILVFGVSLLDYKRYYYGGRGLFHIGPYDSVGLDYIPTLLSELIPRIRIDFSWVIVLSLFGILPALMKRFRFGLAAALMLGIHFFHFIKFKEIEFMPVYPFLGLLAGCSVQWAWDDSLRIRWTPLRTLAKGVVIVLIAGAFLAMIDNARNRMRSRHRQHIRKTEHFMAIHQHMSPNDTFVGRFTDVLPLMYYTDRHIYDPHGVYFDLSRIRELNQEGAIFIHPRRKEDVEAHYGPEGVAIEERGEGRHRYYYIPQGAIQQPSDNQS